MKSGPVLVMLFLTGSVLLAGVLVVKSCGDWIGDARVKSREKARAREQQAAQEAQAKSDMEAGTADFAAGVFFFEEEMYDKAYEKFKSGASLGFNSTDYAAFQAVATFMMHRDYRRAEQLSRSARETARTQYEEHGYKSLSGLFDDKPSRAMPYFAIYEVLALRALGRRSDANALALEECRKIGIQSWPGSLLGYFAGELTGSELLKLLPERNWMRAEAEAVMAIDDFLLGGSSIDDRNKLKATIERGAWRGRNTFRALGLFLAEK